MLHELAEILDVAELVEVGEKKAAVNLAEVTAGPPREEGSRSGPCNASATLRPDRRQSTPKRCRTI
jgi:hypothetical protein